VLPASDYGPGPGSVGGVVKRARPMSRFHTWAPPLKEREISMKRFVKFVAVFAGAPLLALGVAVPTAWANPPTQGSGNPGSQHDKQGSDVSSYQTGGGPGSLYPTQQTDPSGKTTGTQKTFGSVVSPFAQSGQLRGFVLGAAGQPQSP
jgi:hypothetical protein